VKVYCAEPVVVLPASCPYNQGILVVGGRRLRFQKWLYWLDVVCMS
jgi:hypothetical protein